MPEPVGAWMRTLAPLAIAGQPSACAGVGASKTPSNHARVRSPNTSSASTVSRLPSRRRSNKCSIDDLYDRFVPIPDRLHFTGDDAADRLLAEDPFALLVGFALDQQVTVPTAFSGPLKIQQRLGHLDAKEIAGLDPTRLEEVFREKPAVHRFPGAMATRVQELARTIVSEYDGDAASVWTAPRTPTTSGGGWKGCRDSAR